eukprot:TRINITY_DN9197_c0_g1_i3.p2 TRINITY_DN9197_c0_g1~~TRINITY_DN9197_c0_g1_i3.p2  ORF type:complete len:560 (+),score=210.53 TRINITY_DN9197_c0_g1_i3:47-1681(+)
MATAAAIAAPSDKDTRYDRGVRLWGSAGQTALEEAHVCLLGATAAGCEALKNLVLPGVGRVTVVDGGVVAAEDLGRNFFVEEEDIGKPLAEVTAALLQEMNTQNVKAEGVCLDPARLLAERPDFLIASNVNCVIAGSLPEAVLVEVAERCAERRIHVVSLAANFMFGVVRLQAAGEHCVVEGFPDAVVPDLRVTQPFPALQSFFDAYDLSDITDSHEHSHVPWPVLAHIATAAWQKITPGADLPAAYKQRKEVKALLMGMRLSRTPEGADASVGAQPLEEENFNEASNAINTFLPQALPAALDKLFAAVDAEPLSSCVRRDDFWILLRALRAFHEVHGVLPVTGVLPDMTSTTQSYTALRDVYTKEAEQNAAWVRDKALELAGACGVATAALTPERAAAFCRNARNLRVVVTARIAEERGGGAFPNGLPDAPCDEWWYALHLAAERFRQERGQYPKTADLAAFAAHVQEYLRAAGCGNPGAIAQEYLKEWVRGGGVETIAMASILGGVAAQEVIKLVTKQRVPVNHTLLCNGITGGMTVLPTPA